MKLPVSPSFVPLFLLFCNRSLPEFIPRIYYCRFFSTSDLPFSSLLSCFLPNGASETSPVTRGHPQCPPLSLLASRLLPALSQLRAWTVLRVATASFSRHLSCSFLHAVSVIFLMASMNIKRPAPIAQSTLATVQLRFSSDGPPVSQGRLPNKLLGLSERRLPPIRRQTHTCDTVRSL